MKDGFLFYSTPLKMGNSIHMPVIQNLHSWNKFLDHSPPE
jgi:hypothetical protein